MCWDKLIAQHRERVRKISSLLHPGAPILLTGGLGLGKIQASQEAVEGTKYVERVLCIPNMGEGDVELLRAPMNTVLIMDWIGFAVGQRREAARVACIKAIKNPERIVIATAHRDLDPELDSMFKNRVHFEIV